VSKKSRRKKQPAKKITQRRIIAFIHGFLSRLSRPRLWLLIIGLLSVIGIADYFTGTDISMSFFFLAPIAIAAWYITRSAAMGVSIASAAIWFVVNGPALPAQEFSLVMLLWNTDVRLGFFVVVAVLLSLLRRAIDHEKALARTDYLTGVKNDRSFYELADIEFRRARRHHRPMTIAYIDVDNFKELNDRLGHNEGDSALRAIGAALLRHLRATDVVGRMGGDEFAILLPESGKGTAVSIGKRLHEHLTAELRDNGWPITLSMGVVTCTTTPSEITQLMKTVDALMYEVKRSGKNRVRHKTIICKE
jgi:diguanylate cyclase (GGDEF)-like protein